MTTHRVHLIASASKMFHIRATNGLALCGRPSGVETEQRTGHVCATCRRLAKAQGYTVPATFIRGYAAGTKKAREALESAARAALRSAR